jgi:hypothetical protein
MSSIKFVLLQTTFQDNSEWSGKQVGANELISQLLLKTSDVNLTEKSVNFDRLSCVTTQSSTTEDPFTDTEINSFEELVLLLSIQQFALIKKSINISP